MAAPNEVLNLRVRDAIDLSKVLSAQLKSLAGHGDDAEVQAFLARQAEASAVDRDWLLQFSPSSESGRAGVDIASKIPLSPFAERTDEEKVMDGLIAAFAALSTKRAVFLGVRQAAADAGQVSVAESAFATAAAATKASAEAWHFLPSRSKIAFNVLTAGEIDPAIETKAASPLS